MRGSWRILLAYFYVSVTPDTRNHGGVVPGEEDCSPDRWAVAKGWPI